MKCFLLASFYLFIAELFLPCNITKFQIIEERREDEERSGGGGEKVVGKARAYSIEWASGGCLDDGPSSILGEPVARVVAIKA